MKPRLFSWGPRLLALKTRQRKPIETAGDPGWFAVTAPAWAEYYSSPTCSMMLLHTKARAAAAEGNAQFWGMELVWTWNSLWKGQGKLLLVLMETAHQKWSKTLTRLGLPQPTHRPPLWPSPAQSCPALGRWWWEGEITHLWGTEPVQILP